MIHTSYNVTPIHTKSYQFTPIHNTHLIQCNTNSHQIISIRTNSQYTPHTMQHQFTPNHIKHSFHIFLQGWKQRYHGPRLCFHQFDIFHPDVATLNEDIWWPNLKPMIGSLEFNYITFISCNFEQQLTPFALVVHLATRWHQLDNLPNLPPGIATCINCPFGYLRDIISCS